MSIVTLVSGGLDSTVMAVLSHAEGLEQFPLFIDYGQLARERELDACRRNFQRLGLPQPTVAALSGFGQLIPSGITDATKHITSEAFLAGRNAFFLTVAGAFAHRCGADAVAIGLLDEAYSLFPDQTRAFRFDMETLLCRALGRTMKVIAPLMTLSKQQVLAIAKEHNIAGTYSCHAGRAEPCGECISCREFDGLEV